MQYDKVEASRCNFLDRQVNSVKMVMKTFVQGKCRLQDGYFVCKLSKQHRTYIILNFCSKISCMHVLVFVFKKSCLYSAFVLDQHLSFFGIFCIIIYIIWFAKFHKAVIFADWVFWF